MTRSGALVAMVCILLAPMLRAQPAPTCEQWNTENFFRVATVQDVTACLDAGAGVNARDGLGISLLHWTAQFNADPAALEMLLAAGADLGAPDNLVGYTPLHLAAQYNINPAVIEALLAADVDDLNTCADGGGVPDAVIDGRKTGCSPEMWCRYRTCATRECRQRYEPCEPGVLQ